MWLCDCFSIMAVKFTLYLMTLKLAEKLSHKISLPPKDIPNDISQYSTSVLPSSLSFFFLSF